MAEASRLSLVQPQVLTPVLTKVSSVTKTDVDWIAYGFLACGKLTVLDGDPGLGKSTIAIDWASKITRGDGIFDGSRGRKPRGVVHISEADDARDTIRPRVEAAGADLAKVGLLHFETADGESLLPEFPRDGDALGDAVEAIDAALVVIDPLMLYLGAEINANRDAEVRRALSPVIKAAQRTGAAILILRHFTKGGGANAMYRGGGSIAIAGTARIGLMVARDLKTDETGRTGVLACFKNNLAPFPPALAYQLDSVAGTQVARVHWIGDSTRTADSLLDTDERTQRDQASEFLASILESGPMTAKDIQREAREAGFSARTLERAKADLRVRVKKSGLGGWYWQLPELPPKTATEDRQHAPEKSPEIQEGRQDRQDRQTNIKLLSFGERAEEERVHQPVYVCRGCGLPRSRDQRPCPNCGQTEGTER
jgi:rubrerythrin